MDVVSNWLRKKKEEDALAPKADQNPETVIVQGVGIDPSHDQNPLTAVLDLLVHVKHLIQDPDLGTVLDQEMEEEKFQGLDLDLLTVVQGLRKSERGHLPGAKVEAQEDHDPDLEIEIRTETIGKRMIEGMIGKMMGIIRIRNPN